MALDADVVQALKSLRIDDAANPLWAQMLGFIRFKRGAGVTVTALAATETFGDWPSSQSSQ